MKKQKVRTWHRRTNEPEKAYQLFEEYLKLDWKRSVAKVLKNTEPAESVSRSQAFFYAQKYDWKSRAADYDKWKSAREEKHIKARLIHQKTDIARKQVIAREKVINATYKIAMEISKRDLKPLSAYDLLRQIMALRACFEMMGLARLDFEAHLREAYSK